MLAKPPVTQTHAHYSAKAHPNGGKLTTEERGNIHTNLDFCGGTAEPALSPHASASGPRANIAACASVGLARHVMSDRPIVEAGLRDRRSVPP